MNALVESLFMLLMLLYHWRIAAGQLADTADYEVPPDYDGGGGALLDALVLEAGRHALFPELYMDEAVDNAVEAGPGLRYFELRGQPEFEQAYSSGKKRGGGAECPEECVFYKPVCGSDGKVYPSECHMRKENCGSKVDVRKGAWDACRGKHYLCPTRCLDLNDPVCASDGKIYNNVCIMRKRNCGKLLRVLPVKKCYEDIKVSKGPEDCPERCPEISKPVCGNNGVIYFNDCFMKMQTCGQGISEVEMASCVFVPRCPEVCLPFHDPVCGSDGRLYLNQCTMMQNNCGKDVKRMAITFCASRA